MPTSMIDPSVAEIQMRLEMCLPTPLTAVSAVSSAEWSRPSSWWLGNKSVWWERTVSVLLFLACITIAMHSLLAFCIWRDRYIYRLEIRGLSTTVFALSLGQSGRKKGFAMQQILSEIAGYCCYQECIFTQKIKSFFQLVLAQSRDFQSSSTGPCFKPAWWTYSINGILPMF